MRSEILYPGAFPMVRIELAVGETVKVGENFGLRITQIGDVKQLIAALGGGKA